MAQTCAHGIQQESHLTVVVDFQVLHQSLHVATTCQALTNAQSIHLHSPGTGLHKACLDRVWGLAHISSVVLQDTKVVPTLYSFHCTQDEYIQADNSMPGRIHTSEGENDPLGDFRAVFIPFQIFHTYPGGQPSASSLPLYSP